VKDRTTLPDATTSSLDGTVVGNGVQRQLRTRRFVASAAYTTLLTALFTRPLVGLATMALSSDLHSHILLVPLIAAYLFYIRWHELPITYSFSLLPAGITGGVGCAALVVAHALALRQPSISPNDHLALIALSFVCFLAAGGYALLGSRWMRAATFPICFLLFLIPLPDSIVESFETALVLGSAEVANLFFNLSGIAFYRNATTFQLPGIALEVARECSGIRSTWVLFITSILAANLFLQTSSRRTLLVLFGIPLGILRNAFRIVVIGWLCVERGPQMINSIIHRRGGPLFFVLSIVPLLVVLWGLRRSEQKRCKISHAPFVAGPSTTRNNSDGRAARGYNQ